MTQMPAGWYPDPWGQAPRRWWDGVNWGRAAPTGPASGPGNAPPVWASVVGPDLPAFPPADGVGLPRRLLRSPTVGLVVAVVAGVVPALGTDNADLAALAPLRLALGALAVVGVLLGSRLGGVWRRVGTVAPLVFAAGQVYALVSVVTSFGDIGPMAAVPSVVAALATIVLAVRAAFGRRPRR